MARQDAEDEGMNMARTRKPCPGCGEVVARRGAQEVCWRCRELLAEAMANRELLSKRVDLAVATICPARGIRLPFGQIPERECAVLEAAMEALERAAVEGPEVRGVDESGVCESMFRSVEGLGRGYAEERFLVDRSLLEAFRALQTAFWDAVRAAYRKGRRSGANLLKGLASGEMTVSEFNEQVATGQADFP